MMSRILWPYAETWNQLACGLGTSIGYARSWVQKGGTTRPAYSPGGTAFGAVLSMKTRMKENSQKREPVVTDSIWTLQTSPDLYHIVKVLLHPDLPESVKLPTLLFHPVAS